MNKHKLFSIAALCTVLQVFSGAALADTGALASGSADSYGWATRATQKMANDDALKFCNQNNPKKDCKLVSTKVVVRAESNTKITYRYGASDIPATKKAALEACGARCKITDVITEPGFFSLAQSTPDADGNAIFHLAYTFDDSDEADQTAIARCRERSGTECKLVHYGVIAGTIRKPLPTAAPARRQAEASCRPHTPTVRCTSQCTNGNCVVTYENGCRMRVQVQARFDAFTNQWDYPAPSC
jgi:hypothetical protein